MVNAIAALVALSVMLLAILSLGQSSLASVDLLSKTWKDTAQQRGEIRATQVQALAAVTQSAGTIVKITLKNKGEKALLDFSRWDLALQYYDASGVYHIIWLPYVASGPGNNQWTVVGIYLTTTPSTPEVFEPGIFNPEEEMVIQAKVSPAVGTGTTNRATIATPNGVTTSVSFSG